MSARLHVILAGLALAGSLAAAGSRAQAVPSLPGLAGASWVIADFNGDGQPDVLLSSAAFRQTENYHRVELRLGADSAVYSSFQVTGESRALNVVARDVDGDHDLDLVITSGLANHPVGVWINDGQGVFTQGDASAYPEDIWTSLTPSLARTPALYRSVYMVREQRPGGGLPQNIRSVPLASPSEARPARPDGRLPVSPARRFSPRAPPQLF